MARYLYNLHWLHGSLYSPVKFIGWADKPDLAKPDWSWNVDNMDAQMIYAIDALI